MTSACLALVSVLTLGLGSAHALAEGVPTTDAPWLMMGQTRATFRFGATLEGCETREAFTRDSSCWAASGPVIELRRKAPSRSLQEVVNTAMPGGALTTDSSVLVGVSPTVRSPLVSEKSQTRLMVHMSWRTNF